MMPALLNDMPAYLTDFTLALLRDTGWYLTPNAAGTVPFRKSEGCGMTSASCTSNALIRTVNSMVIPTAALPFSPQSSIVSVNSSAPYTCDWTNQLVGTGYQVLSGCVLQASERFGCQYNANSSTKNDYAQHFLWAFGAYSRCLPVRVLLALNLILADLLLDIALYFGFFFRPGSDPRASCLQMTTAAERNGYTMGLGSRTQGACIKMSCENNLLYLNLGTNRVACPSNQTVDLTSFGSLGFSAGVLGPCPDNASFCNSLSCPADCYGNGLCNEGTCVCDTEFTGSDCSCPIGSFTSARTNRTYTKGQCLNGSSMNVDAGAPIAIPDAKQDKNGVPRAVGSIGLVAAALGVVAMVD